MREQLANAAYRKTAGEYAAQGRNAPIYKDGRPQAPEGRDDAIWRAALDLAKKEFPQITRDVQAVTGGSK